MKYKIIHCLWLLFVYLPCNAQNNITYVEYYIDADPGLGLAIDIPFSANTDINNLVLPLNLLPLNSGMHTFNIRAKDALGNWSLVNSTLFYKPYITSGSAINLPNLSKLEYYLDTDPGLGLAIDIPFSANTDINNLILPLNPLPLNSGMHTFNIRAKDALGNWSLVNSTLFYKPYITSGSAINLPNLTKLEYFLDTDPGLGLAIDIPFSANTDINNLVLPFNPLPLSSGIHTFNIRAKDALGNWSLINSTLFYKPYITSGSAINLPNLSKLEYYLDTDPGLGLAIDIPFSANTDINNLVLPFNPLPLSSGIHTFNIRAKDALGNWSLINSTLFYKPYISSGSTINLPNLTKLEYFLDTDPGLGLAIDIPFSANTDINNLVLPLNPIPLSSGIHTFNLRAKDALGNWSLVNNTLFYKPYITSGSAINLPNLTKLEYFIDADPGYGEANDIPFASNTDIYNLVLPINPATICQGYHTFNLRSKDQDGKWSLVNSFTFFQPNLTSGPIILHTKLYLQGYYLGGGIMTPTIFNQGESASITETDSLTIELRDTTNGYPLVESAQGILHIDGTIVCNFSPNVNCHSYYIVVKHRNSVTTWSANPVKISPVINYNFSNAKSKAYGDNQIELENGVFALYSGDLNQDENMDLLDMAELETDMANFQYGYFSSDINGDGNVDLLDSPPMEINVNNFIYSIHP
ncbi:MAG: hypothetical protein IPI46_00990 [Bacteroidetes bacterium]|nr:hypothetical protein [Bacteroidota bacterium]